MERVTKERFYGFVFSYEALLRKILLDCHEAYMAEDVNRLSRCVRSLIAVLPDVKVRFENEEVSLRELAGGVYEEGMKELASYKPRNKAVGDAVAEEKEVKLEILSQILSTIVLGLDRAGLLRKTERRGLDVGVSYP